MLRRLAAFVLGLAFFGASAVAEQTAAVTIKNRNGVPIQYQVRVGEGEWHSKILPQGYSLTHRWIREKSGKKLPACMLPTVSSRARRPCPMRSTVTKIARTVCKQTPGRNGSRSRRRGSGLGSRAPRRELAPTRQILPVGAPQLGPARRPEQRPRVPRGHSSVEQVRSGAKWLGVEP